MVLQIMGSDSAVATPQEAETRPPSDAASEASEAADIDAPQNPHPDLPLQQVRLSAAATASAPASADDPHSEHAPVENAPGVVSDGASAPQQEVRRHGTAKPRV